MTRVILSVVFAVGFLAGPLAAQENEKGKQKWFDMEDCAICKHMGSHPEIMQEMKWETHIIGNGLLMIAVIPAKHKATMDDAHEKMMETIAELEQGKQMKLCGFCTTMGELKMAGANIEELETVGGSITLMTSEDKEVVEKLHEFAKRTMHEHEKMIKAGTDR